MNKKIWILAVLLIVFSGAMFVSKDNAKAKCIHLENKQKIECVSRLIDKFLAKKQVGAALKYLNDYQTADPNFYSTDCHGVVHYIGDKAYEFYRQGYQFDFGKYSNICTYGFYHAFTSSFVLSNNFSDVRDFCDRLVPNHTDQAVGCYHGIGHGTVYNFNEDYGIVDPIAIINKSVELCSKILEGDGGLRECVVGVYDGIGDVVLDPVYQGLTPANIYSYCANQPEKYKGICYENVSHLVYRKTQLGFSNLVNFVLNSPSIKYKEEAVRGLTTIYIVDLKGGDVNAGILVCKTLDGKIKQTCLTTMAFKLSDDAINGKRYQAGRDLCANELLSEDESQKCFAVFAKGLRYYYPKPELKSICDSESVDFFKQSCLNEIHEN